MRLPRLGKLLTRRNRGLLLDCTVFVFNVTLLGTLTDAFARLVERSNDSALAGDGMIAFSVAFVLLQPAAAILKRRPAHIRCPDLEIPEPKPLFHPIFYFLATLLFLILGSEKVVAALGAASSASEGADDFGLSPHLFTGLFLGIPALAAALTAGAYWYFVQPKHKPIVAWLARPEAESVADVLLYADMLLHQTLWGFLMRSLAGDPSGVGMRLFLFAFTAALIYLPPRLYYLAEDGDRPVVWAAMLLANAPLLWRIVASVGSRSVGF